MDSTIINSSLDFFSDLWQDISQTFSQIMGDPFSFLHSLINSPVWIAIGGLIFSAFIIFFIQRKKRKNLQKRRMEELSEALKDDQDYESSALNFSENTNEDSLMEELKDQLEITEETNASLDSTIQPDEQNENSSTNIEEELKVLDQTLLSEEDVFKEIEESNPEKERTSSENFEYDAEQALENLLLDESNEIDETSTANEKLLSETTASKIEDEKPEVPNSSNEFISNSQDNVVIKESIEQTTAPKKQASILRFPLKGESKKEETTVQPTKQKQKKEPFFLSLEFLVEDPDDSKTTSAQPTLKASEKDDRSLEDLGDLNQKIKNTIEYFQKEVITENEPLVLSAQDMVSENSSVNS